MHWPDITLGLQSTKPTCYAVTVGSIALNTESNHKLPQTTKNLQKTTENEVVFGSFQGVLAFHLITFRLRLRLGIRFR